MESIDKLKKALEQGYLLHGSPHFISEDLEPRQSSDSAKTSGNQKALFATNHLVIAVWKAVAHKLQADYNTVGWSWDDDGEKILYAENAKLGNGYVYLLSKEAFQKASDDDADHFSCTPITPIQTISVTPQTLYQLQKQVGFQIDIR